MIGTLILTHGGVARELLAAVEEIAGAQQSFAALSLDWDDDCDVAEAKIGEALGRFHDVDGVLILTDTYGGTPCNIAMSFREPGRVEVLSGVNLPMVMRLACLGARESMEVGELAHWLETKGKQSICVAADLAGRRNGDESPGRGARDAEAEAPGG